LEISKEQGTMTTFAKSSFSAASYAAWRPTYPPALYNHVLAFHRGPNHVLLDVGTGHGLAAVALAPNFNRVIATDPSPGMVAQAQKRISNLEDGPKNITVLQASAEDLCGAVPEPGTVDMAVAAQSAHWFDFPKAWPSIARTLRKGGTLALWTYKDHFYVHHPRATEIAHKWMYGTEPQHFGPYWESGRKYVRGNYRDIKIPSDLFGDETRIEYEPGTTGPNSGVGEVLVRRKMTVGESMEYFRTFSSVHNWQEKNGDPRARKDGGEGDAIDHLYDELREAEGWENDDVELEIEWGSAIIMARKR
jgi:trans-aconitate 3-methyltransferase